MSAERTVVLFANTPWYLFNFRLGLARRLRDEGWRVVMATPDGGHRESLEDAGFEWRRAPMRRRSLNPARKLALVAWLARLLRQERAAVVHGFTLECAVIAALAVRLVPQAHCIAAITGMGFVFHSDTAAAWALRAAVLPVLRVALRGRRVRLVCQNRDDRARIARIVDCPVTDVALIRGSGVDLQRFRPAPGAPALDPAVGGQPVGVLMTARLLRDKGVCEYLTAARLLKSRHRHVRFLLAGTTDPGNPAGLDPATIADTSQSVAWLGHVADLPGLLAQVQINVLPSYGEGLPRVLLEAAACGHALVSTDVPGCREVVIHERTGLLVPPRDPEALAAAIERLIEDPWLRHRLAAGALVHVRRFDEQRVVDETLGLYAGVFDGARRRPASAERTVSARPSGRSNRGS